MDSSGSSQLDLVEVHEALTDKKLAALPKLSKKYRKFARFILDHQDVGVSAPASEVGIKTQTSATTVVRICQALGDEGYLRLRAAIQERASTRSTAVQQFEERLTGAIGDGDFVSRVLSTTSNAPRRSRATTA